jgi:hypothetical protein
VAIPEDDEPTKPGNGEPGVRFLTQVFNDLPSHLERKKLIRLVEDWYGMSPNQRVILEATAGEFVRPTGGV